MAPSIVQQFGSMLSSRWNLGKETQPSPSRPPIHETVTYPRIKVTAENDSCLSPSMAYEHMLACGHIITTAKASEPCAPNCHHVANTKVTPKRKKGVGRVEGEGKDFYCDACAEEGFEALIPVNATATAAENMRAFMREAESIRRGKVENYRKCYIGLKVTSVPCHTDGSIRNRYVPRTEHHPFDTTFPQAGDNFFEDMLVNPEEEPEPESQEAIDAGPSSEAGDSPANLGEAGAKYLEYTRRLAQDETVAGTTHTPRLKLKLKFNGLETNGRAPDTGRSAPGKATPKAAPRGAPALKTAVSKIAASSAATSKTAAPKTAAPKTAAPKTAAPKTAAPKTAAPKTAAPKTAAPKTAAPKTAAPKTAAPKTATPILRTHPTTAAPITQNAKSTTPVISPQRSRKRPMFESEDDYEETEEEEERPAKRRKSLTRAAKMATPKKTSAKSSAKTAGAKTTPKATGAEQTAAPARRISTRGRKSG